ncbi:MAG: D-sedoheptulose 7-phosphate isomerase [Sphingomonadales bacterium]|jgi:D-sedoheptulose 7-phosphate isomerase
MNRERIKQHFTEAAETLRLFMENEHNLVQIEKAASLMAECLNNGGKIISCGNGGSHCDAMHFAEELSGRYRGNRKALAAVAISDPSHISCVGNDYGYEYIFSRYVEALGKPGDILLGISSSGNSKNIIQAMETAKSFGMKTVGLTGKDGGAMAGLCDIEIRAPKSEFADRAQEIHIKVIHALIDSIEQLVLK